MNPLPHRSFRHLIRPVLTTTRVSPSPAQFIFRLSSTMATSPAPQRRFQNPALFICDIQTAFSKTIHNFPLLISTTQKLIRFSNILRVPIYITTQNRQRLGNTVPELFDSSATGPKAINNSSVPISTPLLAHSQSLGLIKADVDKTRFSMYLAGIKESLPANSEVCLVGIESHICVTQTALDLLEAGHKVYVIADAVSSSNKEEVGIALARLRQAGAVVTSSESWMYECMGDAAVPEFKEVIKLVKDTVGDTRAGLAGSIGSKI
ncbi:Isochorismatase-like protein [Cladorrhinum sp. PSN259]|nr:Isochorismatase-like protein [Cladorrhinum sp. PSN259]